MTPPKKTAREIEAEAFLTAVLAGTWDGDVIEVFRAGWDAHRAHAQKLVEALEYSKRAYWDRAYSGSGLVRAPSVQDFDKVIDVAITEYKRATGEE